jgi:hypothetical protein
MRFARKSAVLATILLMTCGTLLSLSPQSARAQAMAPGPALPGNSGGIGLGGTNIAPGPAARDSLIQQEGPGGVPLAPGPSIATQPNLHGHHRAGHRVTHRAYSRRYQ